MYLTNSIIEGLKILSFDKETIKKVSREKSLEEIFLSTLFLNYIIVLIVFIITSFMGNLTLNGRELNIPVIFGLLMIYPFTYNLVVFGIYGLFGLIAEMLDKKKNIKPLLSVGFHTAIVYTIIIYTISLFSTFNLYYGLFVFLLFVLYFIYTMFLSISIVYQYSFGQTLIVLFVPFLILTSLLMIIFYIYPEAFKIFMSYLFA